MGLGVAAAALGAAGLTAASGLGNTFLQRYFDVQDRDFQASREDNAYQRAVADMSAAGINPAMAGGSGGAASSAVAGTKGIGLGLDQAVSNAMAFKQMSIQEKMADAAVGRSNAAMVSSNAQQMKAINDSDLNASKKSYFLSQSALNSHKFNLMEEKTNKLIREKVNDVSSQINKLMKEEKMSRGEAEDLVYGQLEKYGKYGWY